jgi:hypothetical protein
MSRARLTRMWKSHLRGMDQRGSLLAPVLCHGGHLDSRYVLGQNEDSRRQLSTNMEWAAE